MSKINKPSGWFKKFKMSKHACAFVGYFRVVQYPKNQKHIHQTSFDFRIIKTIFRNGPFHLTPSSYQTQFDDSESW